MTNRIDENDFTRMAADDTTIVAQDAGKAEIRLGTDGRPRTRGDGAELEIEDTVGSQAKADAAQAAGIIGEMKMFGGESAPSLWSLCDGSAVLRTIYASLFAVIGTSFGVGDGSTTFNLPDMQGRVAVGSGSGAGLTVRAVGDSGGEETHVLTETELAAHSHDFSAFAGDPDSETVGLGFALANADGVSIYHSVATPDTTLNAASIADTGSDAAHENMPPFVAVNYIIYSGV